MSTQRIARLAGTWYPHQAPALEKLLAQAARAADSLGSAGSGFGPAPVAALLPHAGLHYSAACQMAGLAGFSAWRGKQAKVLILAPSHYMPLDPDQLYHGNFYAYDTPLRSLSAWQAQNEDPTWNKCSQALALEHAIELLLPALAWLLPDASVCAVLVPTISKLPNLERLRDQLITSLDQAGRDGSPVLVLASSDITHYGKRFNHTPFGSGDPLAIAGLVAERDQAACQLVADGQSQEFLEQMAALGPTMCGRYPALLLAALASHYGWEGNLAGYYRSDQAEDCPAGAWPASQGSSANSASDGFVSYAAIRFGPKLQGGNRDEQ